jgi:predicted  nucleic acid-binding Zn ribbon protein
MILANVKFSCPKKRLRRRIEALVESYLPRLLHQGQIGSDYLYAWSGGVMNAYVQLVAPDAFAFRHHSEYGRETLAELTKASCKTPEWIVLDDDDRKRTATWRRAPFLYLFTHAFDDGPAFCRGDNGKPVPSYHFPIPYRERESLYFWQSDYRHHDRIWLGSGTLEIPAYRELVDPTSELSQHGRELCRQVEEATRIPTYYFLFRYWGRRKNEASRKCPGCGRSWRTRNAADKGAGFWRFAFQCRKCRLVSHFGDSFDNERHAAIGEFKNALQKIKR